MFKYVILAAALVASAFSANIEFNACPGQPGPVSLAIPECSAQPCNIAVGEIITLLIGINVQSETTSLPVFAMVTAGGTEVPFDLPSGEGCNAIAGGCPLAPGYHMVTFPVRVEGVTAGVETSVRVQFNNQAGQTVACGIVNTSFV